MRSHPFRLDAGQGSILGAVGPLLVPMHVLMEGWRTVDLDSFVFLPRRGLRWWVTTSQRRPAALLRTYIVLQATAESPRAPRRKPLL